MDLTTPENLEAAIGRTLTAEETPQAEYYISLVSQYIISYTDYEFGTEVIEGYKIKSDYYGVVVLPGPVQEVTDVRYYYGEQAVWQFDGDDQVYGLYPSITVLVDYTRGLGAVPAEIESVATEGAKRLFLSPGGQENGPLIRYKVGDVEEMYKAPFNIGIGGGVFNDLETLILDKYRTKASTFRVGFTQSQAPPVMPQSDTALFE